MVRLTIAQRLSIFIPLYLVLDINECSSNSYSCDVNGVCNNTGGSYTCACKPGYSGDGKNCTGKLYLLNKNYKIWGLKENKTKNKTKKHCDSRDASWKSGYSPTVGDKLFLGLIFAIFKLHFFPRFANKIFPVKFYSIFDIIQTSLIRSILLMPFI